MDKKLLGRWGEELAAEYLKKKRYKIIGMNYRCRMGEIDIIAADRRHVVFVEVKLRADDSFARPREHVTAAKRERLRVAAGTWLAENSKDSLCRFDVIEILAPGGVETPKAEISINHIENAFTGE